MCKFFLAYIVAKLVARINSFCWCTSLKKGGLIIGWFNLIVGIIILVASVGNLVLNERAAMGDCEHCRFRKLMQRRKNNFTILFLLKSLKPSQG